MTLVMTHVSARRVFQSGDFRLTDARTGEPVDYWAQKQIVVQRFGWTALVGFCGIAHTGAEYVPEWTVARLRELTPAGSFERFIELLASAERWLERSRRKHRALTFSIGAFVNLKPTFVLISNFEAVGRPPRRIPREFPAKLEVTRYRPRNEQLFVSGRPQAVADKERLLLLGTFRKAPPPEVGYAALAKINSRAASRDGTIGRPCFTSYVNVLGEWGGTVHDWPEDRDHVPAFMDVHGMLQPLLRRATDEHGRPKPIQMGSLSGSMAVDSDEYYRIALEEKPDDPSILSNYGNWLKGKGKIADAEQAYRRAIQSNERFAAAHGNLAVLLDNVLGDVEAAEPEYRRAVELDQNATIWTVNLALFLWKQRGDVDEADRLLSAVLARQRDAFTIGRRGLFVRHALSDPVAAATLYEEAIALAPDDPWLNGHYASLLWRVRGDTSAARRHFEKAALSDASDILMECAEFEIATGSVEAAVELLDRARQKHPRDPNAIAFLAAARSKAGASRQDVERGYRTALALDPGHPVAALNLAQLLLIEGRSAGVQEARTLLSAVDARPGTADRFRLEMLFYGFAYQLPGYEDAPSEIRALTDRGARIEHWDLSGDVAAAHARRHPHADLVSALAREIAS